MIAWSIEAAVASKLFDHVIVSTDDDEIAEVAKAWGAEVPFMRPVELSNDFVGTSAVTKHAAEWVAAQIAVPEFVCTIYATAPFIDVADLYKGLELLLNAGCDQAFTVTSFPFPIQRAVKVLADGRVAMFHPEHFMTRSQDLEPAYHDAGQFYWAKYAAVVNAASEFPANAMPIMLPRFRVQDIDTPEDWERAELLLKILKPSEIK